MFVLMIFAFLAGIFTVLSPCILPILPVILSAGLSKGRLRPLGIICGLVISFTFFTLALTFIVHATGVSPNVLRYAAIVLIALFGLVMIFPKLSSWFAEVTAPIATLGQRLQPTGTSSGFWSGFLFGIALGLLWTPCAGPILAAITTLVATQAITWSTVLITLTYSLGAAIPMFLIAYGGGKIVASSKFLSRHSEGIRQAFGVLMLLAALAIAFHWDMTLQQKIARIFPPILIEDNVLVKEELEKLRGAPSVWKMENVVPGQLSDYGKAPELAGIVNWINSRPLSIMDLHGKVVLIDFWTYSCINCLRTLPFIEKWYADYKDKGFVVIGVHTPEFEFEKDPQNVMEAAARLGVEYPVAQDNDYKTWEAFHNQYWPAHYLIDQKGHLRMVHFGEGAYGETENAIRELLGMSLLSVTKEKKELRPITPETYLGSLRGRRSYDAQISLKPDTTVDYFYVLPLEENKVGLKGKWKLETERITAESDESFLDLNFIVKQVYLVLAGTSSTPVEIYIDGQKSGEFAIDGDRKYDIANTSYGRHQLSLKIPKGVSAYSFTFGDEER